MVPGTSWPARPRGDGGAVARTPRDEVARRAPTRGGLRSNPRWSGGRGSGRSIRRGRRGIQGLIGRFRKPRLIPATGPRRFRRSDTALGEIVRGGRAWEAFGTNRSLSGKRPAWSGSPGRKTRRRTRGARGRWARRGSSDQSIQREAECFDDEGRVSGFHTRWNCRGNEQLGGEHRTAEPDGEFPCGAIGGLPDALPSSGWTPANRPPRSTRWSGSLALQVIQMLPISWQRSSRS